MKYFERNLLKELQKWVDRPEILSIRGPRQSGKTTLLEILRAWLVKEKGIPEDRIIFVTFEDRELLEKFDINPKDFLKMYIKNSRDKYYFFIDEAHYSKNLGGHLKLLYDTHKNIKFILTGSSSMEIQSSTAKHLVGRVFSFDLYPFNFWEILNAKNKDLLKIYEERNNMIKKLIFEEKDFETPKNDIFLNDFQKILEELLTFGGYPAVVKSDDYEEKKIVLKNIYNTYIEKDIISFLQVTDTIKFKKLVSTLSSSLGGLVSFDSLTSACQTYYKEILKFLSMLEQTYVVKSLRPFHKNMVTELRKNPKIYFLDYGIRNYSINNFSPFELRSDKGYLAENFVLNQIGFFGGSFSANFWRTTSKSEVDFVLSFGDKVVPVEVKFEPMKREKIPKSLHSFILNYSPKYAIVLTKDFWGERKVGNTLVKFIPVFYI